MGKLVLYDEENFFGESVEFVRNEPNLAKKLFNNTAKSARVEGQHWVGYTDKDYKGEFIIFAPDEYKTLGPHFSHKLSSLRLVEEALPNPEIVLYEHVDYKGEVSEIRKKADSLQRADIDNKVSSHKVKQGVWILHQLTGQTGPRLITFKGDEWPNYCVYGWNDKVSSLYPLVKSYTEVGTSPHVMVQRVGGSSGQ